MPISPDEIARLRELEAKATPAPWTPTRNFENESSDSYDDERSIYHGFGRRSECLATPEPDQVCTVCYDDEGGFVSGYDRDLAIAARNALPELLARIAELETQLEESRGDPEVRWLNSEGGL